MNLNFTGEAEDQVASAQSAQQESPAQPVSNDDGNESSSSGSNGGHFTSSLNMTSKPGSPEPLMHQEHFKPAHLLDEEHDPSHLLFEKDMNSSIFIPKYV